MSGFEGALDIQKKTAHALEQERPDLLKRRQDWFDGQLDLDPARLVFIDETGLSTKMLRLRGRALCGERCRSTIPHGHWKTTTFSGADWMEFNIVCPHIQYMRTDGLIYRATGHPFLAIRIFVAKMPDYARYTARLRSVAKSGIARQFRRRVILEWAVCRPAALARRYGRSKRLPASRPDSNSS